VINIGNTEKKGVIVAMIVW